MSDSQSADLSAVPADSYFRLRAFRVPREREDDFTDLCFAAGAAGVAEDLAFVQSDLVYEPDVIESAEYDANVYFAERPEDSSLLKLQGAFPDVRWDFSTEPNKDWLAEWKKGFKPFLFAGDFWIVPSWCEAPKEAGTDPSRILKVEPGMAFGTGTHETTRLAAAYVLQVCGAHPEVRPNSVLDVGTGTGVLAIVVRRLGADDVEGIDNDPEATRTARENLEINGESTIRIPDIAIEGITRQYDCVIANIIDGVLTLLRHELARVTKPGGHLVLSGILTEREDTFFENFVRETGFEIINRSRDGEWAAGLLRKPSR